VNGSSKQTPVLQVMLVLFVAEQVTGFEELDPLEQVITEDPLIVRSLAGSLIGVDQVAEPGGTVMVSPLSAAVTHACTSVRDASAARRLGLDPVQAACDAFAQVSVAISERQEIRIRMLVLLSYISMLGTAPPAHIAVA
jgi:hypothetical protein